MTPYKSMAMPERMVAISLDLEEDHAGLTPDLRYEGLERFPGVVGWFEKNKIPLSIFVAGNFLEKKGESLKNLSFPEYHSHGYWHPPHERMWDFSVREKNINDGLKAFESFFKRKSQGYRAACGIIKEDNFAQLAHAGVQFDSSFFTGVHVSGFHVFRSARPRWYSSLKLMEIPISAHPLFRLPMSMAYMKLMGSSLFSFPQRLGWGLCPLVFNFHLHDLVETRTMKQLSPFWQWIYRGRGAYAMFTEWTLMLKEKGIEFVTMSQLHQRLAAKFQDLA